jgi:hypothetical protein
MPIRFRSFISKSLLATSLFVGVSAFANRTSVTLENEFGIRRAARVQHVCEDFLSDIHYEDSDVLVGKGQPPIPSLRPEPGSIEDRTPGVVAELIHIRDGLVNRKFRITHDGPAHPNDIKSMFERVVGELVTLQFEHPEQRLHGLLDDMISYMTTRILDDESTTPLDDRVTITASRIWEITVACFFSGEEILLNQRVPKNAKSRIKNSPPDWFREIDIVIKSANGSLRWIEVKDWDQWGSLTNGSKRHVRLQSQGQDVARRALGSNIELLLVMKYGIPGIDYLQYRVESHYDDVMFVFPAGMPEN